MGLLLQSKAKTRIYTAKEKAPWKTNELEGTTSAEQAFCKVVSGNCLKASRSICKQSWKNFLQCDLIFIRQTTSSFIKSLESLFSNSQPFKKTSVVGFELHTTEIRKLFHIFVFNYRYWRLYTVPNDGRGHTEKNSSKATILHLPYLLFNFLSFCRI